MFNRRQSGTSQDKTIKLLIEPIETKHVYVFMASITYYPTLFKERDQKQ